MCRIISANTGYGVTLISNVFIDEYMLDADESQLKVYLYLLRHLNSPVVDYSFEQMAEDLDMTSRKMKNVLKYLEQRGLISYVEGENGQVKRIAIENIQSKAEKTAGSGRNAASKDSDLTDRRTVSETSVVSDKESSEETSFASENAPETAFAPDMEGTAEASFVSEQENIPENPVASGRGATAETPLELPKYTPGQMNEFGQDDHFVTLLQEVEKIFIPKTMSTPDMKVLAGIYEYLGFSDEVIIALYHYCADRGVLNSKYVEATAVGWSSEGIRSVEDVKAKQEFQDIFLKKVRGAMGEAGALATVQRKYVEKWKYEYVMDEDVIIEACDRAAASGAAKRWPYADKIIKDWFDSGVKTIDDIKKADEKHKESTEAEYAVKKSSGRAAKGPAKNVFNNFEQRGMSEAESKKLEAELVKKNSSNISDEEFFKKLKGKK